MKVYIVAYYNKYQNSDYGNLRVFRDRQIAFKFIDKLNEIVTKHEDRTLSNKEDQNLFNELSLNYEQVYCVEEIDFIDGIKETKEEIVNLINKLEL